MNYPDEQIQYLEFASNNLEKIKAFYKEVFNWQFTDYGPEYTAFEGKFVHCGFYQGPVITGSILPIIYSEKLEETLSKIKDSEATIVKEVYVFPGGRRFNFTDPDGNEVAVWSEN